jgi:hypothetical protein
VCGKPTFGFQWAAPKVAITVLHFGSDVPPAKPALARDAANALSSHSTVSSARHCGRYAPRPTMLIAHAPPPAVLRQIEQSHS